MPQILVGLKYDLEEHDKQHETMAKDMEKLESSKSIEAQINVSTLEQDNVSEVF